MRKLPLVLLIGLAVLLGYFVLFNPNALKPHNPLLTPTVVLTASSTAVPTVSASATVSPAATPIPTVTRPSPTLVMPTPLGPTAAIVEISQADRDALARLCVVEVRDMGDEREDACLSVIGTVMARVDHRIISDGTVQGTIGWNCTTESLTCQFPAHVLSSGCEGLLPAACAWNYPQDILFFRGVVDKFFDQGVRGSCDGYIFYGITDYDPPECVIVADSGYYQNWHGKPDLP